MDGDWDDDPAKWVRLQHGHLALSQSGSGSGDPIADVPEGDLLAAFGEDQA
jgi:hypothetical protein